MENFAAIIDSIAWPATIILLTILSREYIEKLILEGKGYKLQIQTREIKENKRAYDKATKRLEKRLEEAECNESTRLLRKEMENLKSLNNQVYNSALSVVKERASPIESGSNSDGEYIIYSNGIAIQKPNLRSLKKGEAYQAYFPLPYSTIASATPKSNDIEIKEVSDTHVTVIKTTDSPSQPEIIISGIIKHQNQ